MELDPNVRRLSEGLERLRTQIKPTQGEMVAVLAIYLGNLLAEIRDPRVVEHVVQIQLQGAKDQTLVQNLIKLCGAGR